MSVRLELSDLPPRIRAQAEAQIAARGQKRAPATPSMAAAASIAETAGMDFDSRGEYDYYMGVILPKVQRGQIVNVETHRAFSLLPEKEYGNVKLPAARYTADFVLTAAACSLTLWQSRGAGDLSNTSRLTHRQKSRRGNSLQSGKDKP